MGTYNNPGMLRSLFSLPPSLPYKFHKSIFPYRGRNSMNWKSRFNFNIRAKECKFRPVVERVEGNSRVGFSGRGRGKTFVPIFRSFNDRKRSLRSFVTPPMNIQRWLEGLNFPNERKVCPEDSYGKSCFDNVFAGIHELRYLIDGSKRNVQHYGKISRWFSTRVRCFINRDAYLRCGDWNRLIGVDII